MNADARILKAVEERDAAALLSLVEKGLDANWASAEGVTLLHYAAALGADALADALLQRGANITALDCRALSPAEIAASFGHDALAKKLQSGAKNFPGAAKKDAGAAKQVLGGALPREIVAALSLSALRAESLRTGVNPLDALVRQGRLGAVLSCAIDEDESFKADDFLKPGVSGRSALLTLCEKGLLKEVLVPQLWHRNAGDFEKTWESVPQDYRGGIDVGAFLSKINALKLQTQRQNLRASLKPPV